MQTTALLLAIFLFVSSATEMTQKSKVFLFPGESNTVFVQLYPNKPLSLNAFTLCMRFATELWGGREIILFAYRTRDVDELNIWREKDGRISFYLSSSDDGALFTLPALSSVQNHLCLTWESRTGLSAFWLNGQRSMLRVYRQGHTIPSGGAVVLGQDPDSYLGGFDVNQCFVGDITDVNMWDYVLTRNQIKLFSESKHGEGNVPLGNVIDWSSVQYKINGKVIEGTV